MKKLPHVFFTATLTMFLVLAFALNIGIYGATTGKIQGTVVDAGSGESLPGVNVVIEGTILGAATNEDGYFFVINVPPGTYQLKASMVGYATEVKDEVRVYVDRTTPSNFSLKTQAVAGEEVTVTAERVPVPLDVSSSEAYVSGEDVVESATIRFDDMISLQAGVVLSSDSRWGTGFAVRGGGIEETDLQVDGMTMKNDLTQLANTTISRNLIQDVQILTGGFNAEYGNVRSGLINVITKDGSYNRYSGVIEGRFRPSGYKHFGNYGPMSAKSLNRSKGANRGVLGGSGWDDIGTTNVSTEALAGWGKEKKYDYNDYILASEKTDADGNLIYDAAASQEYLDSHPYNSQFKGWNAVAGGRSYTVGTALDIYRWIHRPKDYADEPDLNFDMGVGGPLPISGMKFYVGGSWDRTQYVIPQSRKSSTEAFYSGKLTKRIKSNMILVGNFTYSYFAGVGSTNINREPTFGYLPADYGEFTTGSNLYQESRNSPQTVDNYNGTIKFTHTYSPSTYYDITIGVQRGFLKSEHVRLRDRTKVKFMDDPDLLASGYKETILQFAGEGDEWTGDGGEKYVEVDAGLPVGRAAFDESPRGFYIHGASNKLEGYNDQIGYVSTGLTQYSWNHNKNTTISVAANVVSQVNKYNQIKAGFEFSNFHANRRGFQRSTGDPTYSYNEASTLFNFITFKADPKELEIYVQDKLEWEGMIMNVGLRTTYWDPNTKGFDVNPSNMFSSVWISDSQWGHTVGEGNWKFQNQRTRTIKNKILLQPRFGVSHPITESSKIFFNYGHFYQRPDFKYMYRVGASFRAGGSAGGNGTGYVPTPDLPWPKTVSYEIGYSQSIYDQVLLQISGYYKDNTNEMATSNGLGQGLTIQSYYRDVWYRTMTVNQYRDIRGIEFRVERSFGRFVNFWANYDYMITSTGTTGFDYLYQDMTREEDQYYNQGQTRVDPRPRFRLSFTLRTPVGFGPGTAILGIKPLAEWRANMIWDWRDGGEFVYDRSAPPSNWDYVQRTNINMIDIYIQKRLAKGATFYLNMQNVFNIKTFSPGPYYASSLRYPWSDTPGNDKYGEYDKYHISTFDAGDEWDKWSPNRRAVYLGIRYQF